MAGSLGRGCALRSVLVGRRGLRPRAPGAALVRPSASWPPPPPGRPVAGLSAPSGPGQIAGWEGKQKQNDVCLNHGSNERSAEDCEPKRHN